MFKEDILKGKKILVTGGGTGLGKEMSEQPRSCGPGENSPSYAPGTPGADRPARTSSG